MSRGLGAAESFVRLHVGLDHGGGPVLVSDIAADWAHWRLLLARPGAGIRERCDCAVRCLYATEVQAKVIRQAVQRMERKGLLGARFDLYGRKLVWAVEGARWRPHDGPGPRRCRSCRQPLPELAPLRVRGVGMVMRCNGARCPVRVTLRAELLGADERGCGGGHVLSFWLEQPVVSGCFSGARLAGAAGAGSWPRAECGGPLLVAAERAAV